MTRIIHLTDLHFGLERKDFISPLQQAISEASPNLIVVTGDLTHRGRKDQYSSALSFLEKLELPTLILPGNHDVPLFNLPLRLLAPFRNWRRYAQPQLSPTHSGNGVLILTANTANPLRIRRGILRNADRDRITDGLSRADRRFHTKILACHHPLREPKGFERGETKGAEDALEHFAATGLDIILSGHLHTWNIGLGITETQGQPFVMVQTGTALCAREDEVDHGFSLIELAPGRTEVTPFIIDKSSTRFEQQPSKIFIKQGQLWHLGWS